MPHVLVQSLLRRPVPSLGLLTRGRTAFSSPFFRRPSSQRQLCFSAEQSFTRCTAREIVAHGIFLRCELNTVVTTGTTQSEKGQCSTWQSSWPPPWWPRPFGWGPMILASEHQEQQNFSGKTNSASKALFTLEPQAKGLLPKQMWGGRPRCANAAALTPLRCTPTAELYGKKELSDLLPSRKGFINK